MESSVKIIDNGTTLDILHLLLIFLIQIKAGLFSYIFRDEELNFNYFMSN